MNGCGVVWAIVGLDRNAVLSRTGIPFAAMTMRTLRIVRALRTTLDAGLDVSGGISCASSMIVGPSISHVGGVVAGGAVAGGAVAGGAVAGGAVADVAVDHETIGLAVDLMHRFRYKMRFVN